MGCYIKKYEELRKELKIGNYFAIVKKGFSRFYTQPESYPDYDDVLDSLGLEIALTYYIDEFNKTYASRESDFSMEVINQMNKSTWKRSPIDPPKTFDILQKAYLPQTVGSYYIVCDKDVEKFDLCRSRVFTSVTNELGLAFVCKHHFDAKFNNVAKCEWENAKIFIDGVPLEDITTTTIHSLIDKASKIEKSWSFPIDLTVHAGNIRKALEDMAKTAKKVSEKIAIDTKAYGYSVTNLGTLHGSLSVPSYGTVHSTGKEVDGLTVYRSKTDGKLKGTWVLGASDLEDVLNSVFKKTKLYKRLKDIRFRYIGKPNTELTRIDMASEIQEIFDEIEHATGDANFIAGEWCECQRYPSVIVNIGSVNIDSKKEPCPTYAYDKILADIIEKALR